MDNVQDHLRILVASMKTERGATEDDIETLQRRVGHPLPDEYLAFLRLSNGAEGQTGPNYLCLYSSTYIASDPFPYAEFVPGLLFIADTGGGGLFAFDLRAENFPVVITDHDDLDLDRLATLNVTFLGFLEFMSTTDWRQYQREHEPR